MNDVDTRPVNPPVVPIATTVAADSLHIDHDGRLILNGTIVCWTCWVPCTGPFCPGTECADRWKAERDRARAAAEQTWRERAAASERAAQIAARQRLNNQPPAGWGYPFPINGIGDAR